MSDPVAIPLAETTTLSRITLVLGGARSGKSVYAEGLIGDQQAVYLATATAGDAEMAERIGRHKARRGPNWTTREDPLDLVGALMDVHRRPILVDCLTLWLSNLMAAGRNPDAETKTLLDHLPTFPSPIVFVSNEVGFGIVPDNKLAREFRDHAGRLHQAIAAAADRVVLVVAGLPLTLKDKK